MADYLTNHACTYCQEIVTGIMIKCMQCENFDLCLQCFSAGAEIGPHKKNHSYQFFDSGAATISTFPNSNWSAREHINLLYSIEKYGYGNFEDIAKVIQTKTPEEAKNEFNTRFLIGNIGKKTWPSASLRRNIPCTNDNADSLETAKTPIIDITKDEATLLGYMPQRNDFEWEYDNSAESQVSCLQLNHPDTELNIALKLAQVDMFIRRLRERTRRKRVANDFGLITNFFSQTRKNKTKNKSKEEREFSDRMRVFTQFHTAHEHEQFLQNLTREQELRLRCSELVRYRQNGITKLEECFHFEQLRQHHEEWKEKRSQWIRPFITSSGIKKKKKRRKQLYFTKRKLTTSSPLRRQQQ